MYKNNVHNLCENGMQTAQVVKYLFIYFPS